MDEDREAEIEALSRVFEWAGAQTRTLKDEGAWEDFKQQGEGVVIVGSSTSYSPQAVCANTFSLMTALLITETLCT
jgi:hypothetical protein